MSLLKLKWRGIGRMELLAWLNEFLQTDYTKIEHLADGIAYCQIFAVIYPGKVNLQRLNLQARTETEYERNFKVLRCAFHRCDIKEEIPIRKLIQGVFQEHFDFLHWVHDYVHRNWLNNDRSHQGLESLQKGFRSSASDVQKSMWLEGERLALQQDEAVEKLNVVESPTYGKAESGTEVTIPDKKVFEFKDRALHAIEHSVNGTLKAKIALLKLNECLDGVDSNNASKQSLSQSSKSRQSAGRKKNTKFVLESEEFPEPDPMTCHRISEVVRSLLTFMTCNEDDNDPYEQIECLELELSGRMKDLQCLEKKIEQLMKLQLSV